MTDTEHLDSSAVAAYLDGVLHGDERERVETHLAECSACCEEVVALGDALRSVPSGRTWRYIGPVAAAAAVLAGLLIVQPWSETPGPPNEVPGVLERAGPDGTRPTIEVLAPSAGSQIDPDGAVLRWRSAGRGARYQVTLTTSEGDSIWAALTTDTTAVVSADAGLERDREFLWYVDALLPDGRTASTGITHFQTSP